MSGMDFNEARNTAELNALRQRLDELERQLRPYMPMIVEADVPQAEDEPSKFSKIGILGFLMGDATGAKNLDLRIDDVTIGLDGTGGLVVTTTVSETLFCWRSGKYVGSYTSGSQPEVPEGQELNTAIASTFGGGSHSA